MATRSNTINTRISLKYDKLSVWQEKNPTLLTGEVAIAYLGNSHTTTSPDNGTHAVLFKVGPGNYNDLPFASALAADVYDWAKQSTKPSYDLSELSGVVEYRFVQTAADSNKYEMQARTKGDETWSKVGDTLDLTGILGDIQTIKEELNGKGETKGIKERLSLAETAIENVTKAGGTIDAKIQALDANVSQTAAADNGQLALSLTQVDGVVTGISGSIAANTYDAYGAATEVKNSLLNNEIKANADAILAINGSDTGNSMRQVATAVVNAAVTGLAATKSYGPGEDGLSLSVTQENGVITGISGAIAAETYDAYGAGAAAAKAVQGETAKTVAEAWARADAAYKLADDAQTASEVSTAITTQIQTLDFAGVEGTQAGTTIKFVDKISQADGIVSAELGELVFNSEYNAETNKAATMADVTGAVADLNGAMHFEGVYPALPEKNKEGEDFKAGDVIIVGVTEYVFTSNGFVQLGDEGALGTALAALAMGPVGDEASTLVISQENGLVSAEKKAIKIAESQVDGLTGRIDAKLDAKTFTDFKADEFTPVKESVDVLKGDGDGSVAKSISNAIANLSAAEVGSASKTLKVKQENGVVTATPIDIQIAISQVTELSDELAKKLDKSVYDTFKTDEFAPVKTAVDNMSNTIAGQINALDANVSHTAGADGLALNIVQTDGVITSVSGSIAANTYDKYGAAADVQGATTETVKSVYDLAYSKATLDEAKSEITKAIQALDNSDAAVEGQFVTAAVQTDGSVTVSRAAVNVKHLAQDDNTYVLFNCGSATEII